MDHGAIVIGAGHNGLICAAYLARAGLDTVVLEARDQVGGCASTVSDLGARFNICNCDHLVIRSTPILDELELGRHGLRYLDLDPAQQFVSWEGSPAWSIFHSTERTLDHLSRTYPDQVARYRAYLDAALPVARLVLQMAQGSPTPRRALRVLGAQRGSGARQLLRWTRMSAMDVMREFFTREELVSAAMATGPAVWGVSPYARGTGLGALVFALKHAAVGGRPVGGSGALPEAIATSFAVAGGTLRTSSFVSEILCEGSRVRGIRLRDGSVIEAGVVVVASDPRQAFVEHLSNPPAAAHSMIRRWRATQRQGFESKLDAVISALPRYSAVNMAELETLGVASPLIASTMISPTSAQIARAHQLWDSGQVAARPIFFANVPSVLDPSMQPSAGEHVFSLEALFTPYRLTGGWPGSREPQRWLEAYATLLDNGQEFLSGVQRYRTMTPDRYEAEFNMPGGYASSFGGTPVSALRGTPSELARYTTPIKGLYLTGAATYPGAGIWGMSGRNTAHTVLQG